jgi:hypothetical protein
MQIRKRGDEIKKKSSLKLLSQSQPNFSEMILGWSSSKIVSGISELFARAQIIADTMEVVLQPMRRVGRQVHRDNPNVNSAEQQCTLQIRQICSKDNRQLIEFAGHHLLLITRKSSLEFIVNVVKKCKVHCCSAELTFGLSL